MFRPQSISSTDARKYFTKIINKVSFSSKSFVVQTYRQPIVRIVNENYISVLEEVLGKKTVNQVMQIAGNDRLFESEKIEQIKKVFQRRLSGSPQQQPNPQPRPQPQQKPATVAADSQSAEKPKPPQPKQVPERSSVTPQKQKSQNPKKTPPTSNNRGVLLLSNGKNYA